jgi:hypothetical protein
MEFLRAPSLRTLCEHFEFLSSSSPIQKQVGIWIAGLCSINRNPGECAQASSVHQSPNGLSIAASTPLYLNCIACMMSERHTKPQFPPEPLLYLLARSHEVGSPHFSRFPRCLRNWRHIISQFQISLLFFNISLFVTVLYRVPGTLHMLMIQTLSGRRMYLLGQG